MKWLCVLGMSVVFASLVMADPPKLRGQELPPPIDQRVAALETDNASTQWRLRQVEAQLHELAERLDGPAVAPASRAARPAAVPTVVPPGFHAHTTTDGRVIVHSDANRGNDAAHAGVPWPYYKSATAGQAVYVEAGGYAAAVPVAYQATPVVYAQPAVRAGPVRRLFGARSCPAGGCP